MPAMARPAFRLHHIALVHAVAQSRTLTEAANRLHVSQPAVSKQLKQLQADLGFLLFERHGHRLVPTFEARALLDQFGRVNASLDVLNRLAADLRLARRGHFQIGCIPSAAAYLLPSALRKAYGADPQVLCTLHTGNTDKVLEWVETQQIDVGVAMKVRDARGLAFRPISAYRLECLLPADHPLSSRRALKPKDLKGYPVIGIELPELARPEPGAPAWDDDLESVRFRVDSTHVACCMAEQGLGIAVVDSLTAAACATTALVRRPFRHPSRTEIGVFRSIERPGARELDSLVAALLGVGEDLAPLNAA